MTTLEIDVIKFDDNKWHDTTKKYTYAIQTQKINIHVQNTKER